MSVSKKLRDTPWFRRSSGALLYRYLLLVRRTNEFVIDPPNAYERFGADMPVIVTMWHGQHFLAPFIRRPQDRAKALVSFHRDAEINAVAAERLGVHTIRGSGDHERRFDRKGGVKAFIAMRDALAEGWNVMLTADVPKVSRVAGLGIIKLARVSGRPIYPIGIGTSRRKILNNWDRSVVNLPFGRGAIAFGEPILVARDADDAAMEVARRQVEDGLNAITARAFAVADRTDERG
ncbi:hypothetical protein GJW-30_1_00375 [Variibacter gotjawalensis]|uniref:DUF374 domain-containing protein n=1 Tax=Variibacter gotjawalensis TaxID=1333996 RepID=A0A0S3PPM0_9BRAD|nr:lysophospholipid acyltransferase family protein [Variibacter gotjawalensis]NIK48162.1 hypothetical protein [Variibacter gotjawalensis]RZS50034.1 hypothetical protein EV661_2484 [Variibacter gotjawalensis]BAT57865.1 hypothetical protein GJW-30_1_00375 [Variibacter gotjawalensis]